MTEKTEHGFVRFSMRCPFCAEEITIETDIPKRAGAPPEPPHVAPSRPCEHPPGFWEYLVQTRQYACHFCGWRRDELGGEWYAARSSTPSSSTPPA
jgi:hypothetical protein